MTVGLNENGDGAADDDKLTSARKFSHSWFASSICLYYSVFIEDDCCA